MFPVSIAYATIQTNTDASNRQFASSINSAIPIFIDISCFSISHFSHPQSFSSQDPTNHNSLYTVRAHPARSGDSCNNNNNNTTLVPTTICTSSRLDFVSVNYPAVTGTYDPEHTPILAANTSLSGQTNLPTTSSTIPSTSSSYESTSTTSISLESSSHEDTTVPTPSPTPSSTAPSSPPQTQTQTQTQCPKPPSRHRGATSTLTPHRSRFHTRRPPYDPQLHSRINPIRVKWQKPLQIRLTEQSIEHGYLSHPARRWCCYEDRVWCAGYQAVDE